MLAELIKILNMLENRTTSIIIVNYRSKENLKKCLFSFYQKFKKADAMEVIVVNNDPSENLDDLIFMEGIKVIQNKENIGFGPGANMGAKLAQGDYLMFLNPDAEIVSMDVE